MPSSTEAQKAYARAYYHANRDKRVSQQRAWRAANPEKKREADRHARRKRAYGLSPQQFDSMLAAQGGVCAICETVAPGGKGTWKVDHDHTSGAVRGLLCNGCNVGLGYFKDNQVSLRKAADYLKEHETNAARNSLVH